MQALWLGYTFARGKRRTERSFQMITSIRLLLEGSPLERSINIASNYRHTKSIAIRLLFGGEFD
jgi:hypothetical protein